MRTICVDDAEDLFYSTFCILYVCKLMPRNFYKNVSKTSASSVVLLLSQALELDENVFMYDNDKESSRVTSKILHVDVKSDDKLISPGNVSFTQDVVTPEVQVISPTIEPDDASQFSYHKFIYSSARDQVCIVIKPENETLVTGYPVYVNFKRTPTLLKYEFQELVSAESNWQICIHPEKMRGQTGIAYLGIQVLKEGRGQCSEC